MQRVVPGRYAANDANRLAQDQRISDLFFKFEFARELRVARHDQRRQPRLYALTQFERHADLVRDAASDFVAAPLKLRSYFVEVFSALRNRRLRPWIERLPRRAHCISDIFRAAVGHLCHHLFGRGVDYINAVSRM